MVVYHIAHVGLLHLHIVFFVLVLSFRTLILCDVIIIIIIIIMEKTEAGLRGLCIREIDVKSQILVT